MACLVRGCGTHSARKKSEDQISFHRFPQDEAIRTKWLELIGRSKCSQFNRICSHHFASNCFVPSTKVKYRRLRENALPTLNLPTLRKLEIPTPTEDWETESAEEPSICRINPQLNEIKTEILTPTEDWEIESAEEPTSISRINPQLNVIQMEIPTPTEYWETESDEEPSICRINPQLNEIKTERLTPREDWEIKTPEDPLKVYCISRASLQQNVIKTAPSFNSTRSSNTSRESACKRYEEIIFELQQKLQRVKEISERRLKKINTLRKRNSRLEKRTSELYSIINSHIDISTIVYQKYR